MFEKIFKLKERGAQVKTELLAGLTTFLAMAYILAVNPGILGDAGMDAHGVFMATAISSAIASILMGMLANYPVALAPGMGVNALFTYTIVLSKGYSYQAALAAVFVSGVVFVLISVTGVRKMIINAIPLSMKKAIGAGIGFFVAFIGLKNAGIIVANSATLVGLGSLKDPLVLLAVFGILLTIFLVIKKVPAAVFVGMVITAVVGLVLGYVLHIEGMPVLPTSGIINTDFSIPYFGVFTQGMGELFTNVFDAIIIIFSFLYVDFFDTAGTLISVCNGCGLVDEKGELPGVEKALLADAAGTVVGAALGTSTVTSFVESTAGVGVGGKTGLTACTTGVLFLLSILISPIILNVATNAVTAPALFVVGAMMVAQLAGQDWTDFAVTVSTFVTIITMTLTYSISNGIALGFIVYTIAEVAAKRAKDLSPIIWVLDIVFIFYYVLI